MTIINQITSFKISGFSFAGTDTQLNYTAGVSGGIAQPSKALVLNSSSDITSGLNSLTTTTLISTNLIVNGTSFNTSILNNLSSLDNVTAGIALESKALILDSSRNIINIHNLTAVNLTGILQTSAQPNITSVGTLTSLVSNGNLNIAQHNGISIGLQLNGTLVVATANELNKLSGLTSSTIELNRLTGLTSSTVELNRLTGLTSSTVELNRLTGMTATTNQLNFVSGVNAGTVSANKSIVVNTSRDITNMGSITSTGSFTLSTGRLFLANSISGLSHKYITGGTSEIITSTNGIDINYIGTSTDNDFSLAVNSTRYITIKKTTGRIGMGTTTPNQELEVSDLSGNCLRLTNSGTNSYMDITINNQGISTFTLSGSAPVFNFSHSLSIISNIASNNTTTGALVVSGGVGIAGSVNIGGNININGDITNVKNLLLTGNNDVISLTNLIPAHRTTIKFINDSLSWELGSRGSAASNPNSFYLFDNVSSNYRLLINSSGNVGIGTTSPTTRLDVNGTIRNTTNLLYAQTSTNWSGTSYAGVCSSNGTITMTNTSVSNNGTISLVTANHLNQITLAAQNSTVTTTNAISLYIANAPSAGANMTITNAYALMINAGRTLLNDNTSSTNTASGALIVTGGVGIGGSVNIGGTLTVTGNIVGTLQTANQPNITSVGTLTSLSTNSLTINSTMVTATASELNYVDITTTGTAEANKALVLNNSRNITNINSLTATNLTGTLQTAAQPNITSTNNLTLPSSLTIINGSTPFNITNTNSSSNFTFTIQNSGGHQDLGSSTANDFSIKTNNTRRLTISSSGNVNITAHNGTNAGLQLNGTLVTATANELNYLDITTIGTAQANKAVVLDSSRNVTNLNNITLNSSADAITLSNMTTSARQNIRFISNARTWELGSRGSGASNPDTFYLWDNDNAAMRFNVTSTGNMGIGVTSPVYRLDVSGTINTSGLLRTSAAGQGFSHNDGTINLVSFVNNSTNPGIAFFGPSTSHALVLQTNSTEHLRISSTGLITTPRTIFTSNSTASTSTTTGALVVSGGVGIGGSVNIGGTVNINGSVDGFKITPTNVTVASGQVSQGCVWVSSQDRRFGCRQISTNEFVMLAYSAGNTYNDYITWTHGSAPNLNINGSLNCIQLYINGTLVTATANELNYLDITTIGTAEASKALVLDASRNITNINNISATGNIAIGIGSTNYKLGVNGSINCSSLFIGTNQITSTPAELNLLDGSTLGTVVASKAIIANANRDISNLRKLSLNGNEDVITLTNTTTTAITRIKFENDTKRWELGSRGSTASGGTNAFYIFDDTEGKFRVYINNNGNVGIGTNNPQYPFHVDSTGSTYNGGNYAFYAYDGTAMTGVSSGAANGVCIFTNGRVLGSEFNATSDSRIKTNIIDIDDMFALNTLRLIQPKKYNYIDTVNRSSNPVWGFIAQQVNTVLDYAVNIETDYIPNIYQIATKTISENGDTILTVTNPITFDSNSTNKLKIISENDKYEYVTIKKKISNTQIIINEILEEQNYFIYGEQVDNLHVLNKDAIFTITTAAVQEIDRNVIELTNKVEEQNTLIQNLQKENNNLKTQISEILARIYNLEK